MINSVINIQDLMVVIIIPVVGLYFAYKQYKASNLHHNENMKKQNEENLKPYQELYYEEFLKVKKLLQNIPILNDKIAILFHQHSKNEKDYLNRIYVDIERSILKTLGDEIWWQNTENLDFKISSVTSIEKNSNHMFNHTKENIMILKNLLDRNLHDNLEISFIKIYDEFSLYFKSVEKDLNIAFERFSNILHKAKKEEVNFTDKLYKEYQQIINLLEFMISLIREISVNEYGKIETLTEDIIIVGIKLKIISELKEKILN